MGYLQRLKMDLGNGNVFLNSSSVMYRENTRRSG
jgi:hypothetical protein